MTERKGSLINFRAECGHWMACYSLEPTPQLCPDCADRSRDELETCLKAWRKDLSSAVMCAESCTSDDVAEWLEEDGIAVSGDIVQKLQAVADQAREACADLEDAERQVRKMLDALPPKAERLTVPAAP